MTTSEVFSEIVTSGKWYGGHYSRQSAWRLKKRHKEGKLGDLFYKRFFAKFGYHQNEITWSKD